MATPQPDYPPSHYGPGPNSAARSAIMRQEPIPLHQLTQPRAEYLLKMYPELAHRVNENPEIYGRLRTESSVQLRPDLPKGFVAVDAIEDLPLPGDDKLISTRQEPRTVTVNFDIGEDVAMEVAGRIEGTGTMVADPSSPRTEQITVGGLSKSFLVWQTNRQERITKRELKKFLDKLWPDITGEELWKRTKMCWEVTTQLQANGWLDSEEAIRMKQFDLRAGSRRGITMRVG